MSLNIHPVLHNLIEDNALLFSLPSIVIELNSLMADPDSSIEQIADLIAQDAALTVRLLQLVNSPYYNFSSPIDTISNAINIIGTRELNDLVTATKMIEKFNDCPMSLLSIDEFWRHNLACATAARVIAAELKIKNCERLFVAGLIHDIGKLLMYMTQPALCESLIKKMQSHRKYVDGMETKILGYSHDDVGAEVLKKWQLPEVFQTTTQYHHHPEKATEFEVEVAVIHLANAVANLLEKPLSFDDTLPLHDSVWKTLDIDSHQFVLLTNQTEVKYLGVTSIFFDQKSA